MDNKKIGLFITNLRKKRNMTQKNLAKKLYVSDKAVSKWERGICMPDIALIEKLANILGVGVSEILKGEYIEKITKEGSDQIVQDSIPFFQKKYFKKKFIRIIISWFVTIILGYIMILIIGEFNNGKISWSIWGNESSIEVPSFSLIKAKKNSEKYIKALQNFDYKTIGEMLRPNEDREYNELIDWITFDEYIETLKLIEKEGAKVSDYKRLYCYKSNIYNLNYTCTYDLTFKYQNIYYIMSTEILNLNGNISHRGILIKSDNYDYWISKKPYDKEYKSIYKMENRELLIDIEKIFFQY